MEGKDWKSHCLTQNGLQEFASSLQTRMFGAWLQVIGTTESEITDTEDSDHFLLAPL